MTKTFLFLFFSIVSSAVFADEHIEISKQEDPEFGETFYGINYPGCPIVWRLDRSSENPSIGIKETQSEKSPCKISLDQQMRLRSALLDRVLADLKDKQYLQAFSWGKLPRDEKNELANRFTIAASKSPQWDKKTGKKVGKAAKDVYYFRNLVNRENIFSELTSLFAAHNLVLRAEDMEMIIVGHVDIPEAGIIKKDTVPIDCSILFLITRKDGK